MVLKMLKISYYVVLKKDASVFRIALLFRTKILYFRNSASVSKMTFCHKKRILSVTQIQTLIFQRKSSMSRNRISGNSFTIK